MNKIKLDSRLSTVASFVRKESRVADIGTDHAYLLCYLIQNGISPSGIGADLRKGPLENAYKTLVEYGITDKVQLILSDGLDNLPENSCDDIVIAGMGGILISEIAGRTQWLKNEHINLIAQPMTHAEVLRKFFVENGFKILREAVATDGNHIYCVICASFTGEKYTVDESYYYLGEMLRNNNEIAKKYVDRIVFTLEKKLEAQLKAGVSDSDKLKVLVEKIKVKISEVYND